MRKRFRNKTQEDAGAVTQISPTQWLLNEAPKKHGRSLSTRKSPDRFPKRNHTSPKSKEGKSRVHVSVSFPRMVKANPTVHKLPCTSRLCHPAP